MPKLWIASITYIPVDSSKLWFGFVSLDDSDQLNGVNGVTAGWLVVESGVGHMAMPLTQSQQQHGLIYVIHLDLT